MWDVPGTREFDDANVDLAIDFVVANGARRRAHTVSYSEVFIAGGIRPPQELHFAGASLLVDAFMERFHQRCIERVLPPLDALVVHVAGERTNRPGAEYFQINGHHDPVGDWTRTSYEQQVAATNFWENQVQRCREWGEQHQQNATD